MTKEQRDAAVAAVLSDPAALWAVKKARASVCGPWVKAERDHRFAIHGGLWRCTPSGKDLATVHPWWKHCDGIYEPNHWDFTLGEEEEYAEAKAKYEKAVARRAGREWVWRLSGWPVDRKTEYASSLEEAQALADAALRKKGVLLLDVLDNPTQKEET